MDILGKEDTELVKQWYHKSTIDYFSAFVNLWIAFNAYYKQFFPGIGGDHEKVRAICKDKKYIKIYDDLSNKNKLFCKNLEKLKEELEKKPLVDMKNKKPFGTYLGVISSIKKMEEVFEILYGIRCNLFHGDKSLLDDRDKKLIEFAYNILHDYMEKLVEE